VLVILVFVVQLKTAPEGDSASGSVLSSHSPACGATPNGTESGDRPAVVMQHEDIERLLESAS
jgi:hypothetical protein